MATSPDCSVNYGTSRADDANKATPSVAGAFGGGVGNFSDASHVVLRGPKLPSLLLTLVLSKPFFRHVTTDVVVVVVITRHNALLRG
jgi:hypothetical protein